MFGILTWPSVCHGAEYHRDRWARFLREEDELVVNTFAKQVPNWCSLHPCPSSICRLSAQLSRMHGHPLEKGGA